MDPPIHTEYFLSGGAMILIFIVGGARAVISFCIRSAIPKKNLLYTYPTRLNHLSEFHARHTAVSTEDYTAAEVKLGAKSD